MVGGYGGAGGNTALLRRLQKKSSGQTPTQSAMPGKSAGSMQKPAPPGKAPSTQNSGTDQASPGKKSPGIQGKSDVKIAPGAIQRRIQSNQSGGNSGGGSNDNDADDRRPAPNPKAPVGQGGRFAAMLASGKSPALAAYIGRKKYGKSKFQALSAGGR